MQISFVSPVVPKTGSYILLVAEDAKPEAAFDNLDKASGGVLTRAMKASAFKGKKEQVLTLVAPVAGIDHLILMGIGKTKNLVEREIELLGGAIVGYLQGVKAKAGQVGPLPEGTDGIKAGEACALLASGARLRRYSFDSYKTKTKKPDTGPNDLKFMTRDVAGARKNFAVLAHAGPWGSRVRRPA